MQDKVNKMANGCLKWYIVELMIFLALLAIPIAVVFIIIDYIVGAVHINSKNKEYEN